MVSGTKFFIYGGGRWREVDINDGRIEGWGRAKFVYPRRGKVKVAKSQAVLAGLRDLAAGQKSVVKDGMHLPYKKNELMKKKEEKNQESACDHSHCCHHSNNNNGCVKNRKEHIPKVNLGVQCVPKTDAGIQTTLPSQTLTFPESFNKQNSRKRRRQTTSSDENAPLKTITTAMVHTNSPKKVSKDLQKRSITTSSEECDSVTHKKRIPSLKLNKADSAKYNIYQRKRTNSTDSVVWVVLPKKYDEKQHLERINGNSKYKTSHSKKKRNRSPISRSKTHRQKSTEQMNAKSSHTRQKAIVVATSDEENVTEKGNPNLQTASTDKKRHDQCKELVIDENDVEVLRNYLLRHTNNFDMLRFDQDDEYKKRFFFKINPLVNVERCQQIARMLRGDRQDVISLKDFASQLGLRSVSELSLISKGRQVKKTKELKNLRDDSDSGSEKENSDFIVKRKSVKGTGKSDKQKNVGKTLKYISSSSDFDSGSEHSEEYDIFRRKSKRLSKNSSLKELNAPPKKYRTRQSGGHINRSGLTEIFSSKNNKMQNSEDSSEADFSKSTKPISRRNHNKVNRNVIDLTSSDSESTVSTKPLKTKIIDGINVKETNDKNSDVALVESSKVGSKNRPTKINTEKSKTNRRKDINDAKEQNADEEETKSKEINERGKTKVDSKNKANKIRDIENSNKEISKENKGKTLNNKINGNGRKYKDLTDSNEESSDLEAPKTSKDSNRRIPIKNDDRKNSKRIVNISKEINTESSGEEEFSKERRRAQNRRNKVSTDSNEDNSDPQNTKTSEKSNRVKTDNKNRRHYINPKDFPKSSDEEAVKTSKEDHRTQNKTKGSKSRKNRYHVDSNDENSEETNIRERNVNIAKAKEINKTKQNLVNNTKNTSTNTSHSDDKEFLAKKDSFNEKHGTKLIKPLVVKPKHTVVKRLSTSGPREYSSLEDQAIVSWVSVGGRALCVNGNRIWRELQEHYTNITGQTRSWHSLRNRYLRYILPQLGRMALPPSQEARLRAAAATGEIKSRKRPARRNSIFGAPSRGALSRRPGASHSLSSEPEPPPKRHKHDHARKATPPSPARALRSSRPPSPAKRPSPRYSEITRHFAAKHLQDESTPSTSPTKKSQERSSPTKKSQETRTSKKTQEKMSLAKKSSAKIFAIDEGTSNRQSSEATQRTLSQESSSTKSLRRSFRLKESPAGKELEKSPDKERGRTRKLFNPSAVL